MDRISSVKREHVREFDCDTCSWYKNGQCTHIDKNAYYPCCNWLRRFNPEKYECDKEWSTKMCDPRGDPEPEPLVIQILIGAEIKYQEGDEGHIEDLKEEIKKAIDEYMPKFTGTRYNLKAMWPYLKKPDHEGTFNDEGSFEYVKRIEEEQK